MYFTDFNFWAELVISLNCDIKNLSETGPWSYTCVILNNHLVVVLDNEVGDDAEDIR